jgi:RNA polymerase sigma-70 factor (sigma-E family)
VKRKWGVDQTTGDFTDFYRQFRAGCFRAVYATVGDRALAEELVSEGFARAWASWRKVCRHPAPQAWVVRTALNLHVSWWRRYRREVALNDRDFPGGLDAGAAVDGDPTVFAALRALPVRQREVVALRILLDLDVDTTADTLGIAPGTVKAHLHRALATMRTRLASFPEKGQQYDSAHG